MSPHPTVSEAAIEVPYLRSLPTCSGLFGSSIVESPPLAPPVPGRGQWTVIYGGPGTGKTTLLRVLALLLADPPTAACILPVGGVVEDGPRGGSARVSLGPTGELAVSVRTTVASRGVASVTHEPTSEPIPRPWVVAYGAGRCLPPPTKGVQWGAAAEIASLFDERAGTICARRWLERVDHRRMQEDRGAAGTRGRRVWNVAQLIFRVLTEGALDVSGEEAVITAGGRPVDRLSRSEIMQTTLALDILARWEDVHLCGSTSESMSDLRREMEGFVLIDDLELGLGREQLDNIIPALRGIFPLMHFVVTTRSRRLACQVRHQELFEITNYFRSGHIRITPRPEWVDP